jgi:hypothetical protein
MATPQSSGASTFHSEGRRLSAAHHTYLRPGRSLHQLGRGVRREEEPARRVKACERSGTGPATRLCRRILGNRIQLRARASWPWDAAGLILSFIGTGAWTGGSAPCVLKRAARWRAVAPSCASFGVSAIRLPPRKMFPVNGSEFPAL